MSLKDVRRSKQKLEHADGAGSESYQQSFKGDQSALLRERRKECGIVQVGFSVREEDKAGVTRAVRDYTDRAWLKMYDAGMVLSGANEARANDIRKRLASNPEMGIDTSQIDTGF